MREIGKRVSLFSMATRTIDFRSAQNVTVEYELASIGHRVAAAMIDFFAFVVYFIVISIVFGSSAVYMEDPSMVEFFFLLLMKLPFILYFPVIEYFTHGQSLGKYILGIRVVTVSGERPGLREVFTRWLFKGDWVWLKADLFVLLWFGIGVVGIIFAATSERRQRLGDLMANTLVVKNKSSVQYNLKDVLSIKNQENYTPTYSNVTRFTDDDMILIKNVILRVKKYPNEATKKLAIEIADRSAELIGLEETPKKRLEFLQTLLNDYVVLTRS